MTSFREKEVEPVEQVLKNIWQSNTYRKDLRWSHFDNEARIQKKQQKKDQQSCIFIFAACLTIPSSNEGHLPRFDNSIPCIAYVWIIEIQSNLGRKKLHRMNKGSIFLRFFPIAVRSREEISIPVGEPKILLGVGGGYYGWREPEERWFWQFKPENQLKSKLTLHVCPKSMKFKQKWSRSNGYS